MAEPFESLQGMAGQRSIPFVCECRSEHCFTSVEVTLAEYDAICADDEHRLIAPGHDVEGEQVVVQTPTFAVVRPAAPGEAGFRRAFEHSEEQLSR
jgi:hypothetical protein